MKKAKKIFIGILSMVLLVGGTVNNTVAKEYATGTIEDTTFKISYEGSVYVRAGAFHTFYASMSSVGYHIYDEMELYMVMHRNAPSNYSKTETSNNCYTLSSSLQGDYNLVGTAYLRSYAEDDLYGKNSDSYTFSF